MHGTAGTSCSDVKGEAQAAKTARQSTGDSSSVLETELPREVAESTVHIPQDRFTMDDINEVIWEEDGKDTSGVWNGHWEVGNARNIKFLSDEKQLWQPLKYDNDLYHCGPRERRIPSPAEQKLSIAEAYTFGAAISRKSRADSSQR